MCKLSKLLENYWMSGIFRMKCVHVLTIFNEYSFLLLSWRCRTYVCGFFDYIYCGVGKIVGKEWNSWFMTVIPFLCGLTVELSSALTSLCELESNQELLFQQSKEDLVKVLQVQLYCYICHF